MPIKQDTFVVHAHDMTGQLRPNHWPGFPNLAMSRCSGQLSWPSILLSLLFWWPWNINRPMLCPVIIETCKEIVSFSGDTLYVSLYQSTRNFKDSYVQVICKMLNLTLLRKIVTQHINGPVGSEFQNWFSAIS